MSDMFCLVTASLERKKKYIVIYNAAVVPVMKIPGTSQHLLDCNFKNNLIAFNMFI